MHLILKLFLRISYNVFWYIHHPSPTRSNLFPTHMTLCPFFFLIYQIQFTLPTSSWVCAKSLRACSIYQEPHALRKLNLPLSVVVSCQLLLGLGREGLHTHLFSPPWQLSGVSLHKAHACCPNCCELIIQMSCCVPETVFLWSPIVSGPYKLVSSSA